MLHLPSVAEDKTEANQGDQPNNGIPGKDFVVVFLFV